MFHELHSGARSSFKRHMLKLNYGSYSEGAIRHLCDLFAFLLLILLMSHVKRMDLMCEQMRILKKTLSTTASDYGETSQKQTYLDSQQ